MWQFKNTQSMFDKSSDFLQEKANELASRLIAIADEAAPALSRSLHGPEAGDGMTGPVRLELIALVLHLADRFSSASFGPDHRKIFMDNLLAATAGSLPGESRRSLKETYSERHVSYSGFGKLYPEEGENMKDTLFWEFGKVMAERFSPDDPASAVVAASAAMDVYQALNRTVDEVGVFKYTKERP